MITINRPTKMLILSAFFLNALVGCGDTKETECNVDISSKTNSELILTMKSDPHCLYNHTITVVGLLSGEPYYMTISDAQAAAEITRDTPYFVIAPSSDFADNYSQLFDKLQGETVRVEGVVFAEGMMRPTSLEIYDRD